MNTLTAYIDGIGLVGPGFTDWPSSHAALTGQTAYESRKTVLPAPASLPPAERRRCGPIVKASLAVGHEATAAAGLDPAVLPTVFSASGGDGSNCHEICEMLASDDRLISPTRFHNSVHNAAAGYWSIATGAMATSSVLCAFDASFGAGLLEAVTQTVVDNTHTLLIACDTTYPEPLRKTRPIPDDFGVGLALAPQRSASSLVKISIALTAAPADRLDDTALEQLRTAIPAARSLPLLRAIARRETATLVLDYLGDTRLQVEIAPC
ncbi:3-oxoacyl-ACP synthase [Noviherbaspirillum cavernae]|uniref:3-oxoacyl-ACP synthase n=1 Tax=Noviherbaspirillum cavernae TaxID=2320862 RepID=A0A418X5D6_9BURK|nr:beta-ketoacyl synthase chain length factor [Noviherbaspirillum cavernae]RJG07698.1 3-oxoacyl-ACP synthase [Noviherbaspirillum cavernae]